MKNLFDLKLIIPIVSVAVIVSIFSVFFYDTAEANNINTLDVPPRAVIIDQLYYDVRNDWFHEKASQLLEEAGYEVDIFTTEDVTVDFYKKLPLNDYKIVVVRSHGVADANDQDSVTLFTGEKYTTDQYISEQLFGQVKKGAPLQEVDFIVGGTESEWVIVNDTYRTLTVPANTNTSSDEEFFLITPTFVDDAMKGKFSETIFLLGGCSTMHTDTMAKALVKRGAETVIGWDDTIGSGNNDFAMLLLLEKMFADDMKTDDAVDYVMSKLPIEYMQFPSRLLVYT
jgi:hypothetical protein